MIGQKHSDRMRSSRKSAKAEWARSIARVTLASIATSRSRHRGPQADALHYDVAPDGGRFLIITRPATADVTSRPIAVVLNWLASVKK
jgi:hypothetical protein